MGVHYEGPDYRPHLWWHQSLVSSRFEKLPFNNEKLFLMSRSFFNVDKLYAILNNNSERPVDALAEKH